MKIYNLADLGKALLVNSRDFQPIFMIPVLTPGADALPGTQL